MTAEGLTLFQDACFHYLKVEGRDCRATKQPTGPLPGRSLGCDATNGPTARINNHEELFNRWKCW